MKTIILLSTFFFFNVLLQAQLIPNWITKFEVPYTQMIAIEDLSANKLVALKTKRYSKLHQVITINKETGDTAEVLKLDGGSGFKVTALKADYSGNVIVAGTYKKEIRIGAYEKKSETHVTKTFLAKFKPGQALDTTKIQHFEALETSQLGVLPNNEIVLSGFFRYRANILGQQLEAGLDDVFVMKLTPDFQLGWIKNYGEGSDERTTSMHVSKDGNIIVAAKFNHKFNLGENNRIELTPGNNSGAAMWKMSPSGSIVWYQVFSGYKNGRPEIVKITSDDSYLFLGMSFSGDCLMDGDTFSSMGRKDLSIVRLNQSGKNRQLIMHVKSPYDVEIAGLLSTGEELFLAGNFQKRIHIKDELVYAKGDTSGYTADTEIYHLMLNKLSNNYQLNTIGSPDSETCQAIATDENNFYLAGTYDKSFQWGEFSLNNQDAKPDAYITALTRSNNLSSITDTPDENGNEDEDEENDQIEPGCPDPTRPTILSIEESTNSLTVNWRKVDRALHYELLVSTTATMSDIVYRNMNIGPAEDPSFRIESLEPDQTYYVRVFVEINCKQKREKSMVVAAKTKPSMDDPSEGESTPEHSNNPEEQDATGNSDNDCLPPPAKITKVIPENYAFTAFWDAITDIKHYILYVSNHQDFSDTVYVSKPIYPSNEPSHRVLPLHSKSQYYFNIVTEKQCDGSDVLSRSITKPVTTTCVDDTIVMQHNDGDVQFQIVDCEGNIKCMGAYFNDTSLVIGECNDGPEGELILPSHDEPILVGPIDPTKKEKCEDGQWPVPIKEAGKPVRFECVEITQTVDINHSCYDHSTDRERIICLANEGIEKVGKLMDRMSELREEVFSMKIDESMSEEEKQKLQKQAKNKMERFEAIKDTLDIIRADYEERLNAIVVKGNIVIDVKNNGAGMTINPKAFATSVRWSKYDDAFKYPGPQLLFDIRMSNFPRKTAKGALNKRMINTIDHVQMQKIGKDGEMLSGVGTLGTSQCIQQSGFLRTNIAILSLYENLSHVSFSNPYFKNIDPRWYSCSPKSLTSKNADKHFLHDITSSMNENDFGGITSIEFHMLLSQTTLLYNTNYSKGFKAYYYAINKMSNVFFDFYTNKEITYHILGAIRSHVEESYNDAFLHNRFRIYYGFKELDPTLKAKIKKLLE